MEGENDMPERADRAAGAIAVTGNLNMDLLMGPLPRLPEFGHELFVPERSLRSAGQVYYTVLALAALGAPPRLVASAGDDAFGAWMLDDLRAAGIDVSGVPITSGYPTGLSVALLDERRDRAFVTHPGHLGAFDVATIFAHWERIAGSRLLLFCGYCCLPALRPDGGPELLRRAQSEGIATVLDTGWDPEDWSGSGRAEVRAMLRHTDLFTPNMEEARALTGHDDPAAAAALAELGPATVVIKLGPDGALALQGERLLRVPAPTVTVAETVGAGDTFNAGLLYALARDWPLDEAVRLAIATASYAIGGHTPRCATLEQARALMDAIQL